MFTKRRSNLIGTGKLTKEHAKDMAKLIVKTAHALHNEGLYPEDLLYNKNIPNAICFCDECEALLNIQKGFEEAEEHFRCSKCGYINRITPDEICNTFAEYEAKRKKKMA